MDNRQVLLSLIRQNFKKISGIVNDESKPQDLKKNIKVVNNAINHNFFVGSNKYFNKDYRLLINDISLFKFFVMQNDIMNKMFRYKDLDFKYFLKDCKDLNDNYKYEQINSKYIRGNYEYEKLVPQRAIFDFDMIGAPRIKELTKTEYDSITEDEKSQVLLELTNALYLKNKNANISFEEFVKDINYGDFNEKISKLISSKEQRQENNIGGKEELEDVSQIQNKKHSKNKKAETVVKNEDGYYYGEESKQGYLFVEEDNKIEQ